MKYLLIALLFVLGCKTNAAGETDVDWNKLDVVGDEVLVQLDDQLLLWRDDPEAVKTLYRIREAVVLVDKAVSAVATGGGTPQDVLGYVEAAIDLVDVLRTEVDPTDRAAIATLSAIRGSLSILRIAAS